MLRILALILLICFTTATLPGVAQSGVYSLSSEVDDEFDRICQQAQSSWAIDFSVTEKNLADIYQSLNFNAYQIEVITCNRISSSAVAYQDKNTGKRYILINEQKQRNLNVNYKSHLFIIAHEFAHHALNHFGIQQLATSENKKRLELQADTYAAKLVKKLNGTLTDCLNALDMLNHPSDDTYSSHPVKSKRVAAVQGAFDDGESIDTKPETHSAYTDLFSTFRNCSLLKYENGLNKYDISYYYNKTNMIPKSIVHYNNNYWIYWEKKSDLQSYSIYWNYIEYPTDVIKEYFKKGFNIEFLEKINGRWYMVLLKYPSQFPQATVPISKSEFYSKSGKYTSEIKDYLERGYSIQNMIDDGDNFLVLFTKTNSNDHYSYAYRRNYEDFKKWYTEQEKDGYNYMYCFKHIDDYFFGFMEVQTNVTNWTVLGFDGTDLSTIRSRLNDGYQIDNISQDNNYIRFTMCKYR